MEGYNDLIKRVCFRKQLKLKTLELCGKIMRISITADKGHYSNLIVKLKELIETDNSDEDIQSELESEFIPNESTPLIDDMRKYLGNTKSYVFQLWLARFAMLVHLLLTLPLLVVLVTQGAESLGSIFALRIGLALLGSIMAFMMSVFFPLIGGAQFLLLLLIFHPLVGSFTEVLESNNLGLILLTAGSALCLVVGIFTFWWLSLNFTSNHFRIKKMLKASKL